ncbi:speract receptor-like [Octopus vulgaris]|uniref:guanylate cyclase n=1 Tax=Octopus vulgaris TaxID=6645 RepID=A0AA36BCS5_OCTVU|nr:speract receptor-like [Octopus vulgaris]
MTIACLILISTWMFVTGQLELSFLQFHEPPAIIPDDPSKLYYSVPLNQMISKPIIVVASYSNETPFSEGEVNMTATIDSYAVSPSGEINTKDTWAESGGQLCQKSAWWLNYPERYNRHLAKTRCHTPHSSILMKSRIFNGKLIFDWIYHKHTIVPPSMRMFRIEIPDYKIYVDSFPIFVTKPAHRLVVTKQPPLYVFANIDFDVEVEIRDERGNTLINGLDSVAIVEMTIPYNYKRFYADPEREMMIDYTKIRMDGKDVTIDFKTRDIIMRQQANYGRAKFTGVRILDVTENLQLNITLTMARDPWSRIPACSECFLDIERARQLSSDRKFITFQRLTTEEEEKILPVVFTRNFSVLYLMVDRIVLDNFSKSMYYRLKNNGGIVEVPITCPLLYGMSILALDARGHRIYSGPHSTLRLSINTIPENICFSKHSTVRMSDGKIHLLVSICEVVNSVKLRITVTSRNNIYFITPAFRITGNITIGHFGDLRFSGDGKEIDSHINSFIRFAINDVNNGIIVPELRKKGLKLYLKSYNIPNEKSATYRKLGDLETISTNIHLVISSIPGNVANVFSPFIVKFRIPYISTIDSTREYIDKDIYPLYNSISWSEEAFYNSVFQCAKDRFWTDIVILRYHDINLTGLFYSVATKYKIDLRNEFVFGAVKDLKPKNLYDRKLKSSLEAVKRTNLKVIFLFAPFHIQPIVFREAYLMNLSSLHGFQWVLMKKYAREFPFENHSVCNKKLECTLAFTGTYLFDSTYNVSGYQTDSWKRVLNYYFKEDRVLYKGGRVRHRSFEIGALMGLGYDAVHLYAKAFAKLLNKRLTFSGNKVNWLMRKTTIHGLTDKVSLNAYGDRIGYFGYLAQVNPIPRWPYLPKSKVISYVKCIKRSEDGTQLEIPYESEILPHNKTAALVAFPVVKAHNTRRYISLSGMVSLNTQKMMPKEGEDWPPTIFIRTESIVPPYYCVHACGYKLKDPALILIGIFYVVAGITSSKTKSIIYQDWMIDWDNVTVPEELGMVGQSKGIINKTVAAYRWDDENWYVKKINSKTIPPDDKKIISDMVKLTKTRHYNLIRYGGCCLTYPNVSLFMEIADKGSIADVLANETFEIGWEFGFSFLKDICCGMEYLHDKSEIKSHGRLKSSNCLVDKRWTVRLSGFGAPSLRYGSYRIPESEEMADLKDLFWTAPELLRDNTNLDGVKSGTPQGDVYSFAIVACEIVTKVKPYHYELKHLSEKSILDLIKDSHSRANKEIRHVWESIGGGKMIFTRPILSEDLLPNSNLSKKLFKKMLEESWNEMASSRPTFNKLSIILNQMYPIKGELIDKLIQLLETYSNNLEMDVIERTRELEEKKAKAEQLLGQMLPPKVACELKQVGEVIPELFENATVFFSDIVNFGRICKESKPMEIVDFLNEVYKIFDSVLDGYDVYKVETISASYMVVSGIPEKNGDRHAGEIATMALDLMSYVTLLHVPNTESNVLQLRIGMHSGPVRRYSKTISYGIQITKEENKKKINAYYQIKRHLELSFLQFHEPPAIIPDDPSKLYYSVPLNQMISKPIIVVAVYSNGTPFSEGEVNTTATIDSYAVLPSGEINTKDTWAESGGQLCQKSAWWLNYPERYNRHLAKTRCHTPHSSILMKSRIFNGKLIFDWIYHKHTIVPPSMRMFRIEIPDYKIYVDSFPIFVTKPAHRLVVTKQPPLYVVSNDDFDVEVEIRDEEGNTLINGLDSVAIVEMTIPYNYKRFYADPEREMMIDYTKIRMDGENVTIDFKTRDIIMRQQANYGKAKFTGVRILDVTQNLQLNITLTMARDPWSRIPACSECFLDIERARQLSSDRKFITFQRLTTEEEEKILPVVFTRNFTVIYLMVDSIALDNFSKSMYSKLKNNGGIVEVPITCPLLYGMSILALDAIGHRIYSGPDSTLRLSINTIPENICFSKHSTVRMSDGKIHLLVSICEVVNSVKLRITVTSMNAIYFITPAFRITGNITIGHFGDLRFSGDGKEIDSHINSFIRFAINDVNNGIIVPELRKKGLKLYLKSYNIPNEKSATYRKLGDLETISTNIHLVISSIPGNVANVFSPFIVKFRIPYISTIDSTREYIDKDIYPLYNSISWSEEAFYNSVFQCAKDRFWTDIVILRYHDINLTGLFYSVAIKYKIDLHNEFVFGAVKDLKPKNLYDRKLKSSLEAVKRTNLKVIFLFAPFHIQPIVFREAYLMNLSSLHGFQWVLMKKYAREFPFENHSVCNKKLECTLAFTGTYLFDSTYNVSGYQTDSWKRVLNYYFKEDRVLYKGGRVRHRSFEIGALMGLGYDAVHLYAKAFAKLLNKRLTFSGNKVNWLMRKTTIHGLTDKVSFNAYGDRIGYFGYLAQVNPIPRWPYLPKSKVITYVKCIKRSEDGIQLEIPYESEILPHNKTAALVAFPVGKAHNTRRYISLSGMVSLNTQKMMPKEGEDWPPTIFIRTESIVPPYYCVHACGYKLKDPGPSCGAAICEDCNFGVCVKPGVCECTTIVYFGENCAIHISSIIVPILVAALILISISYVVAGITSSKTKSIIYQDWMIDWDNVTVPEELGMVGQSKGIINKTVAAYRWDDENWYVKKINSKKIPPDDKKIISDMVKLTKTRHYNLIRYGGCCLTHPNVSLFMEIADKGSIADVLANETFEIGWEFGFSFLKDICCGMEYLHDKSEIKSHGRLKSSNCLVDKRWTVRLSGFGAPSLRYGSYRIPESEEMADLKDLFWTAPELLRDNTNLDGVKSGTPQGDVYSFAIVACEIATKVKPYHYELKHLSEKSILDLIKDSHSRANKEIRRVWESIGGGNMIFTRPILSEDLLPNSNLSKKLFKNMLEESWNEKASSRPTFNKLSIILNQMYPIKGELIDKLIQLLETYSNNLEMVVIERTRELEEKKAKAEQLLGQMLPPKVACELKQVGEVIPELFENATVFFSDIVNFGRICKESKPMEIVDFLNEVYKIFDSVLDGYDVYKVETISASYMVVSGIPEKNGDRHAGEIATMALDLMSYVTLLHVPNTESNVLQLRIGMHSGPVRRYSKTISYGIQIMKEENKKNNKRLLSDQKHLAKTRCHTPHSSILMKSRIFNGKLIFDWIYHKHTIVPPSMRMFRIEIPDYKIYFDSFPIFVTKPAHQLFITKQPPVTVMANHDFDVEVEIRDEEGNTLINGLDSVAIVEMTIPYNYKRFYADPEREMMIDYTKIRMDGEDVTIDFKTRDIIMRQQANYGKAKFTGVRILDVTQNLQLNITLTMARDPWSRIPACSECFLDIERARQLSSDRRFITFQRLTIEEEEKILPVVFTRNFSVHYQILNKVDMDTSSKTLILIGIFYVVAGITSSKTKSIIYQDWMIDWDNVTVPEKLDICCGMEYLHDKSEIKSHGRLKSSNCLVDKRWTVRLSGFGAPSLRYGSYRIPESEEMVDLKDLFWTAPELLRDNTNLDGVKSGTPQGDVYSFAIIACEIATKVKPYHYELKHLSEKSILDLIKDSHSRANKEIRRVWESIGGGKMIFTRPILSEDLLPNSNLSKKLFKKMLEESWNEKASSRPTFNKLSIILNQMYPIKGELIDKLIHLLETYSNNLEMVVIERTREIEEKKANAEQLLGQMLPPKVACELKQVGEVIPELFENATVFFSDIVNFGRICKESKPMEIVDFLNEVYKLFHSVLDGYDVYKVETISASYMVVSGIPEKNGDRHAGEIATMALDLISCYSTPCSQHGK